MEHHIWRPYAYIEDNDVITKSPLGKHNDSARAATELLLRLVFKENGK